MQRNIIILNLVFWLAIVTFGYTLTVKAKEIHVPADEPTIQGGINAANSGDTVIVAPGLYKESIELKSGVEVLGAGPDSTIIKADWPLFAVSAQNITSGKIDGFQIDIYFAQAAVFSLSSSFTISNNLITSSLSAGGPVGILCRQASEPIITNNTIRRHFGGIVCDESSNPVITENVISGCTNGIGVASPSPVISNNVISGFGYTSGVGINCSRASSGAMINDNIITSVGVGIGCESSSSPTIVRNKITGGYGIRIAGGSYPIIGGTLTDANDIYATLREALYNDTSNTINARYNYWGTVEENQIKALIFDSSDDATKGSVIYSPWTDKSHTQVFSSSKINPDMNGDGIVDIFDLVMIGKSFGRKLNDGEIPEWLSIGDESNPDKADVNDDGSVDIFDMVLVAKHFGEETKPPAAP